ncbi:hypothetical protein NECAME_10961 [Necator americanus]|uniref:Endonuclease/exonuclease/phosphatase domain-containing protein n=1 Tax=Necator americanus TaxID=51031 RepID=W2T6E4_NECAM|nr:hypothetical protein NECAME_10961 [Necator americanus]ETN77580.1 hypothetical protein NECAME_10961 [Necator americanus]
MTTKRKESPDLGGKPVPGRTGCRSHYDVIGLTETRRRHPLNAVYETGEELLLGTCDSRGVGGVDVLVNMNVCGLEDVVQLQLWLSIAYAPTSSYEEEVEAFYMDLEKFYQEDHALYKVIIGDFNAKVGPRRTSEELRIGTQGLQWNDQGERISDFDVNGGSAATCKMQSVICCAPLEAYW